LMIKAKKDYFDQKIGETDNLGKTVWNIIGKITGNVRKVKSNSTETQKDSDKLADNFNTFFTNIGNQLVKNLQSVDLYHNDITYNKNIRNFEQITENELILVT